MTKFAALLQFAVTAVGQPVSACVSGDCGRTQVLRFTCAIRKNPCALLEGIVYYILNMGTSRNDKG